MQLHRVLLKRNVSELYEESGEKIDTRIQKIALGRLGTPEDVANACAFLVSDVLLIFQADIGS